MMHHMDDRPFDLRQLEAFAAVMSAGSITGAARLTGRSQPAVTRLIQELEADLGFRLFHRSGPRIAPTDQAVQFHEEVERILVGLNQARARTEAIARAAPRPIEIAAIPALAAGIVPVALAQLGDALPGRVHLHSTSAEQVAQSVLARTADLGVASLPIDHPGLEVHWIGEAACVAAVPVDDPLAARPQISLADLAGRRLVTMANPYRLRRRIEAALGNAGIAAQTLIETNSSLNALLAARAGLGVALIEPVTAFGVPLEGIAIRRLDVAIPFLWGVVTPLAKPRQPSIDLLIEKLKEAALAVLPDFRLCDPAAGDALADAVYGRDTATGSAPAAPEDGSA